MSANILKMTLAEWLMRMSVAKVAPAARALALYASVLDITGNDELATVAGFSGRTFDKHKADLVKNGWVLISRRAGGRGRGIEVTPAINETPVKFTDVSIENPREICARLAQQTPATSAGVSNQKPPQDLPPFEEKTPADVAPVSVETPAELAPVFSETPAELAPVFSETPAVSADVFASRAPAPAYKELPSEVVIISRLESPPTPSHVQPVADWRRAFGAGDDPDVCFVGDRLTLTNGTHAAWLARFGGDQVALDLALIEAAGSIQRNSNASLKLQVERKLASIVRDDRGRDRRYNAAVKRNAAQRNGRGSDGQPIEGKTARLLRLGAELDAERRAKEITP